MEKTKSSVNATASPCASFGGSSSILLMRGFGLAFAERVLVPLPVRKGRKASDLEVEGVCKAGLIQRDKEIRELDGSYRGLTGDQ